MFCFDSLDNQWKEFNCDHKQWRVCESMGSPCKLQAFLEASAHLAAKSKSLMEVTAVFRLLCHFAFIDLALSFLPAGC